MSDGGKLAPSFCHCGRHLAIITAPDNVWRMWQQEAEGGNFYPLDMAYEFCESCWANRSDTGRVTCT